jgi:CheY-like chemotaxis protein
VKESVGAVASALSRKSFDTYVSKGGEMKIMSGKTILVVQGSLLATAELKEALEGAGATVCETANLISAYGLLDRVKFDGAVIDQALHNEAFDLCEELRAIGTPYVCCNAPHRLQGSSARGQAAQVAAEKLARLMSEEYDRQPDPCILSQFLKSRRGGGGLTGPDHGHAG